MKKLTLLLALLVLVLSALSALAEQDNLGNPMPDFSFVNTEGETITLSEVLKEKDLVHISVFTTWCGPCKDEFPGMEKVYDQRRDRMEIFALSDFSMDTMEDIRKFKADMGMSFHFGLTEGTGIQNVVSIPAYPVNIFIDRFGNIAYIKVGAFYAADDYARTVDHFLGDDYAETDVLYADPSPAVEIEMPDAAQLSAVLNASGGVIEFANVDDGKTYPFVCDARNGHAAAYAGNLAVSSSVAAVSARITADEGDALSFQVGCDVDPVSACLSVDVDGVPVKCFTARQNFETWAVPLTAGEHEVRFTNVVLGASQSEDAFMAVKNVAVLTGDDAAKALEAVPTYPVSDAARIALLNTNVREAVVTRDGREVIDRYSVLDDEILRFRITLGEKDDPNMSMVADSRSMKYIPLSDLPVDGNAYIYECRNADKSDYGSLVVITNYYNKDEAGYIQHLFCRSEDVEVYPQAYREMGNSGIDWCYLDELDENGMNPESVAFDGSGAAG